MEVAEHIAAVEQEGKLFAAAANHSGLEAEIAPCPGWNMRDLVRHLSEIHLWAAARVAKRASHLWPDDISEHVDSWPELAVFWPEDRDLVGWYLQTNTNLVEALEKASPEDDLPTFLPAPSPLAMWARRQAHETAIHRYDAESPGDSPSGFAPVFAADGIDEILSAFAPRKSELPVPETKTMHVHAADTDDHWYVAMGPDGINTTRIGESADLTVSGRASDLYLLLWNRTEDSTVDVSGDRRLLDLWHGNHRVRWS